MVVVVVTPSTPDRRRQVAEAVLQIIASRGTDAVSVREVAAALDVSIGAIQHYFSTKAEMVEFAFGHSVQRVRDRLIDLPQTGDRARDIRTVLSELLPLDETRRAEVAIHLAFASLAATTPGLQSIQRDLLTGIRNELSEALGPGHDTQAAMLLGAVDGLALHAISAPGGLDADQLERALAVAVTAALHPTRKKVRKHNEDR
ncbi:TetR family transcriptional regulator [Rhodococcus sp. ACS1]|nr:TetR family transcriptional regulator [Rhodococcus sp. ACS1]